MYLVTGSTGLVGSHIVCELLMQGKPVVAMHRASSSREWLYKTIQNYGITEEQIQQYLQFREADILDVFSLEEAMEGVEIVFHCAAMVSFQKKDQNKLFENNIEGTANVVNACLYKKVKKLLYISSIASLGRRSMQESIDEKAEWEESKLNSNYSKSKYLGEMEVWRGQEEGLAVAVVNPGVILGFGDPIKSSASLFQKVKSGFKFYTTGSSGFVDVVDVAKASILVATSSIQGQRYILVGHNISYKDLFFGIAEALQVPKPSIEIKAWALKLGAGVLDFLALLGINLGFVSSETLKTALSTYHYSSIKIQNELGFEFSPLKGTLQRVANEFKHHHIF